MVSGCSSREVLSLLPTQDQPEGPRAASPTPRAGAMLPDAVPPSRLVPGAPAPQGPLPAHPQASQLQEGGVPLGPGRASRSPLLLLAAPAGLAQAALTACGPGRCPGTAGRTCISLGPRWTWAPRPARRPPRRWLGSVTRRGERTEHVAAGSGCRPAGRRGTGRTGPAWGPGHVSVCN